jgi:acetyl esterase/lipase
VDAVRARVRFATAAAVIAALAVVGCSSEADTAGPAGEATTSSTRPWATEALDVAAATAPATLGEDVAFYPDVRCGDAERNVIDVALPATPDTDGAGVDDPSTPLVIHLHGGGFTQGDKSGVWEADEAGAVAELLEQGIAVASMNYSLLEPTDPDGVLKPLTDAARCLQFMRYHGPATFGIDPDLVALRGGSAGAGTAMWLAVHDDLAEPGSDDPILRQSTKPLAVVAHETQATYDLVRWSSDVFGDHDELFGDKNLIELAEAFGLSQRLLSFYGITDSTLLESPEVLAYRDDVDLLSLMDDEDPPAWIANTREEDTLPVSVGLLFHHADHARALERQARAVDYDAVVTAGPGAEPSVSETEFLTAALLD